MQLKFNNLDREDVVSVSKSKIIVDGTTFTVEEFVKALMRTISNYVGNENDERRNWFNTGLDCKVLIPGTKGWQKGKVRITLEFCPDEQELIPQSDRMETNGFTSPLDDLRKLTDKVI